MSKHTPEQAPDQTPNKAEIQTGSRPPETPEHPDDMAATALKQTAQSTPQLERMPQAPPYKYSGNTVFDLIMNGGLFLVCFSLSLIAGPVMPDGQYSFLRTSSVGQSALIVCAAFSALAVLAGIILFFQRRDYYKRMAVLYPQPEKPKSETVWEAMSDAIQQMLGLKPYIGMPEEDTNKPKVKRSFMLWLKHRHTRTAFSFALLFLLLYSTPLVVILIIGHHSILVYLMQFTCMMGFILLSIIAWLQQDE